MLLPRRKASEEVYLGQKIAPTCLQRCRDIVVGLKFFYFDSFSFLKKYN